MGGWLVSAYLAEPAAEVARAERVGHGFSRQTAIMKIKTGGVMTSG